MKKKTLGILIKKYRMEKNITQAELAERLNVSEKAVSSWECGRTCPDTEMMGEIRKVLGVSLDELYDEAEVIEKKEKLPHIRGLAIAIVAFISIAAIVFLTIRLNNNKKTEVTKETESETEIESETDNEDKACVVLKLYSQLSGYQGIQQGWFATLLRDKFNAAIDITFEESGKAESDMMEFGSTFDLKESAEEGKLVDLEENNLLSEHGSNITKDFEYMISDSKELCDGKLYGLFSGVTYTQKEHHDFYAWFLDAEKYKEIGSPKITNLDDYMNVLAKIKEKCSEGEYPAAAWGNWSLDTSSSLSSGDMLNPSAYLLASAYYGYEHLGPGLYNNENGDYYDALMINSDGTYGPYIAALAYYNKLKQQGLLYTADTYNEVLEQFNSKKIYSSIVDYAYMRDNYKELISYIPEDATPVVYPDASSGRMSIAISQNSEHKELCMDIINWMYSKEGQLTLMYGPQGVCWDCEDVDNDGLDDYVLTEFGMKAYDDLGVRISTDDELYKINNGEYFSDGRSQLNFTPINLECNIPGSDEKYDCITWKRNGNCYEQVKHEGYVISAVKGMPEIDDEDSFNNVAKVLNEYSWKAVLAENDSEFANIIEEMTAKAKAQGYDKIIEEFKKFLEQ